mmetsp:Transcript_5220/g.24053  ORF Transcript_5220/g.24053 Transcript_5220/m.24053 type:complete len:280 (-) Transcript_5220:178-1017(-)
MLRGGSMFALGCSSDTMLWMSVPPGPGGDIANSAFLPYTISATRTSITAVSPHTSCPPRWNLCTRMRFPRVNSQSRNEYPSLVRKDSSGARKQRSTSSGFGTGSKSSGIAATTGLTLTWPFDRNGGSDASTFTSLGVKPTSSDASLSAASTSSSPSSFFPPGRQTSPAWVLSPAERVQSSTCTPPSGPRESGTSTDARRDESGAGSPPPFRVSRAHHRVSASAASSMPRDAGRLCRAPMRSSSSPLSSVSVRSGDASDRRADSPRGSLLVPVWCHGSFG